LKNPLDSRFYDFCQFLRKGAVKLTLTKKMDGKYPLQDLERQVEKAAKGSLAPRND